MVSLGHIGKHVLKSLVIVATDMLFSNFTELKGRRLLDRYCRSATSAETLSKPPCPFNFRLSTCLKQAFNKAEASARFRESVSAHKRRHRIKSDLG